MKANDYYMGPYTHERKALWLFGKFLPELTGIDLVRLDNALVTTREHVYISQDGYRTALIASLWYEGRPFMLTSSSGRGGDEYKTRYITDFQTYRKAVGYLWSLVTDIIYEDAHGETPFLDPNEEKEELDWLYGTYLPEGDYIGKETFPKPRKGTRS